MCLSSCYFSPTDPGNVGDRMIAGLISAAIITPVNMFFPFMFKRVNTFRSTTVSRIEAIKKLQVQKTRRQTLFKGGPGCISRVTFVS